jgi:hypothetical protein
MGLERKNLAVDPKAADSVVGTELKGNEQGVCVLHAKTAQLRQGVGRFIMPMAVAVVSANLIG